MRARKAEAKPAMPGWGLALRFLAAQCVYGYVHTAYRVRRFGIIPPDMRNCLLLSNHQIELDAMAVLSAMGVEGYWRKPVFAACARVMYEPGFLAIRVPWLYDLLHDVNLDWLFAGLGFLPIENELLVRSLSRWAYAAQCRHGEVPLTDVFAPRVLQRFGYADISTKDVFDARFLKRGTKTLVKITDLLSPYREEALTAMRRNVEADLQRIEDLLRSGGSFYITPEGEYTRDGSMRAFRAIWDRLSPLVRDVFLLGVSYDPFIGRRLTQTYRIVPLRDKCNAVNELKRARPITTSALLCAWLEKHGGTFTCGQAVLGVEELVRSVPPGCFVDPHLRETPDRMTLEAIENLRRLRIVQHEGTGFVLSHRRRHASFPNVEDIVAFQARMFAETVEAGSQIQSADFPALESVRRGRSASSPA